MTEMGRLEFASARDAWGGEASDFTPSLAQADLLEYLGQATGIGSLVLVEVEHTTAGNRSLDILAETPDGRRVSIENQYRQGDHDHLTRGLAYAVATGSQALIVVAENHRDEFISIADYLNSFGGLSDATIGVWLVKVRAVRRIGDTIWSPEFVVQAEPNDWEASIKRATVDNLASLEDFYRKCADATDHEWAETARQIIEDWTDRPNATESHNSKYTVSLYYPSPRQPDRGSNVLQIDTTGALIVQRGYILETTGVYDGLADGAELDEQIRAHFPSAKWPEGKYYIRESNASGRQVAQFSDWLTQQFRSALES